VLIINLKQNKEIIHANKIKERKPMHDDNNIWIKRIKKLKKEREYTCNPWTLKFKEEKNNNLVICYHEIDAQHY
jgi:hypothetical protein